MADIVEAGSGSRKPGHINSDIDHKPLYFPGEASGIRSGNAGAEQTQVDQRRHITAPQQALYLFVVYYT